MKRLLVIMVFAIATIGGSYAQSQWVYRVGIGTNAMTGKDVGSDEGSKFGYQLSAEWQNQFNEKGGYYGVGLALGSRGWKYSDDGDWDKLAAHNIQVAPTFGWKFKIKESDFKIDPHASLFLACDYVAKYKEHYNGKTESYKVDDDYKRFDVGMNIGVGVWYKNFNLDLMYQKGFLSYEKDYKASASNFLVRFGIAF